jgi:hypothetical protein
MNRKTFGRLALALTLALLVPTFTIGCGGSQPDTTEKDATGTKAAMEQGAASGGQKGQALQAPPAPPP